MNGHLGDALSALLDDELAPDERRLAAGHLDRCDECRDELERVSAGRSALRSLPQVEPPAGFLDRLLAASVAPEGAGGDGRAGVDTVAVPAGETWRRAGVGAAVAVAASVALLVLGAGLGRPDEHVPPMTELMAGHDLALAVVTGPALPEDEGWREVEPSAVPPPYPVPRTLAGGFRLVAAFDTGEGLHLLYGRRGEMLSLVEVPGRVDHARLPSGGRTTVVDGVEGWHARVGGRSVALLERDGMVQVAVASTSPEQLVPVVASAPEPRPLSFWQRVRRTCERTVDEFGVLAS